MGWVMYANTSTPGTSPPRNPKRVATRSSWILFSAADAVMYALTVYSLRCIMPRCIASSRNCVVAGVWPPPARRQASGPQQELCLRPPLKRMRLRFTATALLQAHDARVTGTIARSTGADDDSEDSIPEII